MSFTAEFYNNGWPLWDDMKMYGPTARHTRRLIFQLLRRIAFQSVLDVGCGTGILLSEFASRYPDARLAGSEISEQALEFGRQRLPKVEFFTLDLAKQKLDGKFDLVTCIDVLEHVDDDMSALKNLYEMSSDFLLLAVPLGPLFNVERERMGHTYGYSREEVDRKLRICGFDILKVVQWGFPFYNLHRRIVNNMRPTATTGKFRAGRKMLAEFLYRLFFLNVSVFGERYYVLCRVQKKPRHRKFPLVKYHV